MPFEIVRNDITRMKVDAIVNAANCSLLGGGGVDGAIHAAAGPELLEECRTLGGCPTGEARITGGYRLPAKYVIHTPGPVWHGGGHGEKELLAACYRNSLQLALAHDCGSVAFPMISTGVYGYPPDEAMAVAVAEISRFLLEHDMTVYLVVFGRVPFQSGKKLFRDVREFIDDAYAAAHYDEEYESRRRHFMQSSCNFPRRRTEAREEMLSDSCCLPQKEAAPSAAKEPVPLGEVPKDVDWKEMLKRTDEGFSARLLRLIDERGMTDPDCYRRANVDRKLFSKIRSNPEYRPGKTTVFAFAVSLRLDLDETKDLLERAGFAMSQSSKLDLVMEYLINHRCYDVFEINELLFELDLPLLGSGTT